MSSPATCQVRPSRTRYLSPGAVADAAWYAFYTRSRHEKRVEAGFTYHGIESYLPLLSVVRQWHDRKKVVEMPLFPGYVFARLALRRLDESHRVPGVVRVVALGDKPTAIRERDLDNIRRFVKALVEAGLEPEPTCLHSFEPEEPVRVTEGPLAGIEGRVTQLRGDRVLMRVGLDAVAQAVRVEVEPRLLERLDSATAGHPAARTR